MHKPISLSGWKRPAGIVLVLIIVLELGFLLLNDKKSMPDLEPNKSANKSVWLENDDVLLYLETISQLQNHDMYLAADRNNGQLIQDSLKYLAERIDPFAAYLTASEFINWKQAQGDDYIGIGMEIVKNQAGQVICLPYPGTPAEKAGIHNGDQLLSIANEAVQGRSILAIGALARGAVNTDITLSIQNRNGEQKTLSLTRSAIAFDSVTLSRLDTFPVIKISAFTPDTPAKLKKLLATVDNAKPLVIDLRGNAGGEFSAAVDAAKLFLSEHKTISAIKTKQTTENYPSDNSRINTSRLFLWQDAGTASSAEVFIAALTRNQRATSLGKNSFGKGSRQEILQLSDGSALFITTGLLQTPDGEFFDGKGLAPDANLAANNPKTSDYLLKLKELLQDKSKITNTDKQ
ncbi:MAG: PDZ domain-containing protein [Methylococcaceae bacterium]|nr:PDZ domain-containing protein [Methylococcaceae bacterium]